MSNTFKFLRTHYSRNLLQCDSFRVSEECLSKLVINSKACPLYPLFWNMAIKVSTCKSLGVGSVSLRSRCLVAALLETRGDRLPPLEWWDDQDSSRSSDVQDVDVWWKAMRIHWLSELDQDDVSHSKVRKYIRQAQSRPWNWHGIYGPGPMVWVWRHTFWYFLLEKVPNWFMARVTKQVNTLRSSWLLMSYFADSVWPTWDRAFACTFLMPRRWIGTNCRTFRSHRFRNPMVRRIGLYDLHPPSFRMYTTTINWTTWRQRCDRKPLTVGNTACIPRMWMCWSRRAGDQEPWSCRWACWPW